MKLPPVRPSSLTTLDDLALPLPANPAGSYIFFTMATRGGAWIRLLRLATYLDARGYHVEVVSPPLDNTTRVNLPKGPTYSATASYGRRGTPGFALAATLKLLQSRQKWPTPIRLCNFSGLAGVAFLLGNWITPRTRCIISIARAVELQLQKLNRHESAAMQLTFRAYALDKLMSSQLRQSDIVITQSWLGRRDLLAQYRFLTREDVHVLPNDTPHRASSTLQLNQPPSVRGEPLRIAFLGRLVPYVKGLDVLISALAFATAKCDIELHILGDGPAEEAIVRQIRALDLSDCVKLHGWQETPGRLLESTHAVIVPSRVDACPNAVFEGFASQRIVLGARASGIPELLNNDELLFSTDDEGKELGRKLVRLSDDRVYFRSLHDLTAARAAHYRFDWEGVFERIVEARILGDDSRRTRPDQVHSNNSRQNRTQIVEGTGATE